MKAILNPDRSFRGLVPDDVPTRASATRAYVDNTAKVPDFDPGTHRLVTVYAITKTEVTASVEAVPLTASELSERSESLVDDATITAMRNARASLEAGNLTARQVQEALARIIRLLIRRLLVGSL